MFVPHASPSSSPAQPDRSVRGGQGSSHQHPQAHQAHASAEAEPGRREGAPEARIQEGQGARSTRRISSIPTIPFTLNNLGYIAELEGQADRAERYYSLAQAQGSDAIVYKSTERAAIGKPVDQIAGNAADSKMQVNRINVYAIGLLRKDQAPEADVALQKALKLDPQNPFTLNNLGYAREKEGELEQAYKFYSEAAAQHSDTPIVVSMKQQWRGKPISEIAEANANKVRNLMEHEQSVTAKVARLNTRGVAAINRNDFKLAKQYFQEAYQLDPKNAFALNNMGYLAEIDGDRETADFYYDKAREADQSSMKVAYASRKDVEGMKLAAVANDSDSAVNKAIDEAAALRRAEGGPVVLRYRNNQPVMEPATPPKPIATANPTPEPPPSGNRDFAALAGERAAGSGATKWAAACRSTKRAASPAAARQCSREFKWRLADAAARQRAAASESAQCATAFGTAGQQRTSGRHH